MREGKGEGEREGGSPQRASVVIRLAHISKKSMVWEPWRGASRGALQESDPGREELSWGRSMAGLAESMLSLGLWRPAVEPERWGVDEPDLNPTASIISSGGGGGSVPHSGVVYNSRDATEEEATLLLLLINKMTN